MFTPSAANIYALLLVSAVFAANGWFNLALGYASVILGYL